MSAPKTLLVAMREFKATAMTKAFIFAVVFMPVLMMGLIVLGPLLFNPKPPPLEGSIVVIDPAGVFSAAADVEFAPDKIKTRVNQMARDRKDRLPQPPTGSPSDAAEGAAAMRQMGRPFDIALTLDKQHTPSELKSIKSKVQDGTVIALVTTFETNSNEQERANGATTGPAEATPANTQPAKAPELHLYIPSNMNIKHTSLIEDLVEASAGRAKIVEAGMDVETVRQLTKAPETRTIRVSREGAEKAETGGAKAFKMIVPMAFMMLIWMGSFVSANYLLTTTIEEKSNKVMEVLLSAVSPLQLMTGKIIGQACVGLLMVGMYLGMGVAALVGFAAMDLIEWWDLVFFGVYYIMAYFMIASIMAAIGSAVNELREAQSLMTPAMLLLMIPLMLWLPISDSPNGMLATVTSFIPPLIPFVMILRVTGGEAIPLWQIPVTMVWGFVMMLGMIWMSAKIFRVGVLMYGKPPSPLELLKWVRYR